jgi:hypothetical protein
MIKSLQPILMLSVYTCDGIPSDHGGGAGLALWCWIGVTLNKFCHLFALPEILLEDALYQKRFILNLYRTIYQQRGRRRGKGVPDLERSCSPNANSSLGEEP